MIFTPVKSLKNEHLLNEFEGMARLAGKGPLTRRWEGRFWDAREELLRRLGASADEQTGRGS